MKEKLVIKNFGPIKSVELELGRFNVLIGENATGKSTVAKVLAVCRYFSYLLSGEAFGNGLEAWGLVESALDFNEGSIVKYQCSDYRFEAHYIKEDSHDENGEKDGEFFNWNISLKPISEIFANLLSELEKINPILVSGYDFSALKWIPPSSFFENDVKEVMDNPFYLQPERGLQSIFSIGKNSINNLSDSLFNQLAEIEQISRRFKKDTFIEPLDVYYKNVNGQGFVRKEGSTEFYSMYNSASGYKSTIPIVLVLKKYIEEERRKRTFIIEEPELNLFPIVQNKLMQYLVDKTMNYGNMMLLTTHSPYILTSLNNMMYAYELGQKKENAVGAVMDKKYWLNPNEVSAYRMLEDGTCRDIMDKSDEGILLIKAEELDEISGVLNEQFDALINIELSSE